MKGKWMYNLCDNETWIGELFDTKEQAIEMGKKELLENKKLLDFYNNKFYVGQIEEVSISGIDVDFIIENVAENTVCECGEVGDDYLCDVEDSHREELEEELNKVLFKWIKKHNYEPNFFNIVNVEEIIL